MQTNSVRISSADSWTYVYDKADRLTSADNLGNNALDETFVYAANDNLLSRTRVAGTYVYPAASSPRPHAPTSVGSAALTYDGNGNLTADGTRTFAWDKANRLQTVTLASATTTLLYAPDGSRAQKIAPTATALYPDAAVEITAGTTPTFTRYPHPDIKVAGATKSFLHRDHLASVRLVTTSTGTIAEATGYAAYGERTNAGFQTSKSYIGERFDPEGVYVRRWLPELGGVPLRYLHKPWTMPETVQRTAGCVIGRHYPGPIVSPEGAVQRARAFFAAAGEPAGIR